MRCIFVAILLLCSLTANAQDQAATFPADTVALIDRELPHMDKAVAKKDRAWFGPALEHAQAVLALWEKRQGPSVLEQDSACTEAATDFLIVGLCKILPPGSICEPETFFPKAQRNIDRCRALAAARTRAN